MKIPGVKPIKPLAPITPHGQLFPAEHIARQFGAVHQPRTTNEEGYGAQRDMYEVDRAQNYMAQHPYGISSGPTPKV